jgi:hypothetical protein
VDARVQFFAVRGDFFKLLDQIFGEPASNPSSSEQSDSWMEICVQGTGWLRNISPTKFGTPPLQKYALNKGGTEMVRLLSLHGDGGLTLMEIAHDWKFSRARVSAQVCVTYCSSACT